MREQGLRLLLEAARLVELRLDAVAALVDAFDDELVHPEIAEHADEEDEGDRDPEFGFEHLVSSALEHVADGGGDVVACRRGADQPLDDRRRGLGRDAAHVRHGRVALRRR